jgi:hypothetical protein
MEHIACSDLVYEFSDRNALIGVRLNDDPEQICVADSLVHLAPALNDIYRIGEQNGPDLVNCRAQF